MPARALLRARGTGSGRPTADFSSSSERVVASISGQASGIEARSAVIPKSTHRERIEENAQIFDFTLSDDDMADLDALDRTGGTDRALERKWW